MSKVSYQYEKHIVTQQHELEKGFMDEFSQGNFTLENPLVVLNPYMLNPLSALVLFKTEERVTATVTVAGKTAEASIEKTFSANTTHILPILGLYPDHDNDVEIFLSSKESKKLTISTSPLPEGVDVVRSIETKPEYMKDNMMFITPTATSLPLAVDHAGDCRWFLTKNFTFNLMRAQNGNLIIGSDRLMHPKYHMSGVVEMDMLGKIYTEYCVNGCYHHDQIELEDGNLIILAQDFHSETIEDQAVLIDRNTGEELKRWDFKDVIPQDVGQAGHWYAKDWFHNNAVWYDKKTHSLSFSGRHQDVIINMDFETGKLNWILGDPENWPAELVEKYFFTPVGDTDNFDWQYEQHACLITPNGDVMCFDNGNFRSKDPEKRILNKDNFSRGVRYRINTDDMTIEQVWQFGKELGADFFSPYICNVEYYDEGHYMVHSGGIAYKDGVCSELMGAILDPNDPGTDILSRTVELVDDVITYDMTITGQYYRAEKLPLYHDKVNHSLGAGRVIGELEITQEMDVDVPAEDTGLPVPDSHEVSILEEEDRFIFKAKFEKGTLAMLVLEGAKRHNYYINTAKDALKAVCVATFIDRDDRWIQLNVNKRGLEGECKVKLIVEDKMYDTGVTVNAR